MAEKGKIPVIIGVGDVKNSSTKLEGALEPLDLIVRAIEFAIKDSGASDSVAKELLSNIDSLDVVQIWTWAYPNLAGSVSQKLGIRPKHEFCGAEGGSTPAKFLDEAARRVASGESKVALITGGEALASLAAFQKAGKLPPPGWTPTDTDMPYAFGVKNIHLGGIRGLHSVGLPTQVYAMYENGLRAHTRQSMVGNHLESARLYGAFAQVAEKNPFAWRHGKPAMTAKELGTVTKQNRLINFPYTLFMNAFNTVNLAAACLLTDTEYARKLGIPESRWVYPLGGAGTSDLDNFWERPNFYSSGPISRSIDTALNLAGLRKDDIDLFDFYSCFPIVPKIACHHLGLSIKNPEKPITLLGGLTFFGGAGNNYSMHAINAMVRQLRNSAGRRRHGLVLANGGVLTYQHVVVLSSQPRKDRSPYPSKNPLPEVLTDQPLPIFERDAEGEAVVETYTVGYDRDGNPIAGYVFGRLVKNNNRFIANEADEYTLNQLSSTSREPIGRIGYVTRDPDEKERGLFRFEAPRKL